LINHAEADGWQPEPPPNWWTAASMFRLGKFRRGIAALLARDLAVGDLPGYAQFYDAHEPRYDDGFIGHNPTNDLHDPSTGFTHDTSFSSDSAGTTRSPLPREHPRGP
jgi:hypothetical protein